MNIEEFKRKDMEGRLADTFAIVEATSYEQLCLWRDNANPFNAKVEGKAKWEQVLDGWLPTVGNITKKAYPVAISLHWCLIDGRPVLFWHATSQMVDHRMIEAWLKKQCPNPYKDQPTLVQDAQNFHIVLHAIARANKEQS